MLINARSIRFQRSLVASTRQFVLQMWISELSLTSVKIYSAQLNHTVLCSIVKYSKEEGIKTKLRESLSKEKTWDSRWQTLYHQIWHPGSSPYWETSKKNLQFLQLINTSPGVWRFFSEFLVWMCYFRGPRQIGSSKETGQISCSFVESNQWEWGNQLQVREALDRFKDFASETYLIDLLYTTIWLS